MNQPIANHNRQVEQELNGVAREQRLRLINDAFNIVSLALGVQDVEHDLLAVNDIPEEEKVYTFFVLEDYSHLPFDNYGDEHCMVVQLGDEVIEGQSQTRLMLFVPCPPEVTVDEHCDPSMFKVPGFIALKETTKSGLEAWYIVDENDVTPYIPEVESGEELRADDMIDDDISTEMIMRGISKQVDSRLALLAHIRESLVNMKLFPQRFVTMGEIVEAEPTN